MHRIEKVDLGYFDLQTLESEEGGRRYVTPDGHAYPSITTVLGETIDKSFLKTWKERVGVYEADRITRHAATRGTALHDSLEKYLLHEPFEARRLMPHVQLSYRLLSKVLEENLTILYAAEAALYSDSLAIAGRVDAVGVFNGIRSIIDFKTSRHIKRREDIFHYFQQAAAYSIMFEERTGIATPQLVILMAVDNCSEPLMFVESRDEHVSSLKSSIATYYKIYN
jgi:hypothetical protein